MIAYLDGASISAIVALFAGGGATIWRFIRFKLFSRKRLAKPEAGTDFDQYPTSEPGSDVGAEHEDLD